MLRYAMTCYAMMQSSIGFIHVVCCWSIDFLILVFIDRIGSDRVLVLYSVIITIFVEESLSLSVDSHTQC